MELIKFITLIAPLTKDSPFDVENGVLKKYHWQKCEETENEKRKSVYNKKYDLGELGTGEEL